jgi:integral membrane protein (TIGR01906 family)
VKKGFSWLIAIAVPVILLMTSVRLLLTPTFVDLEYSMPGFPEDSYGFTSVERRQYAKSALEYLLNDEDVSFLGGQQFPNGAPLYNERELGHMQDVKGLTQIVLDVWLLLAALLVGGIAAAWHFGHWETARAGLVRGGQIAVGLVVAILIFVALSFNALFTGFHRIFFEGDTWLFSYSDTLIRLFPMRFWQDVFIALGVLTLAGGLLFWFGFNAARRNPAADQKGKKGKVK